MPPAQMPQMQMPQMQPPPMQMPQTPAMQPPQMQTPQMPQAPAIPQATVTVSKPPNYLLIAIFCLLAFLVGGLLVLLLVRKG
jgi:hypothetical protein